MRMAMSPAAAGLLRCLVRRAGIHRDRILLTEFHSTDWQSLCFIGEQHRIRFRIPAPDSAAIAARLTDGLEESEFSIPGHIVADVTVVAEPETHDDCSISMTIEALTVQE